MQVRTFLAVCAGVLSVAVIGATARTVKASRLMAVSRLTASHLHACRAFPCVDVIGDSTPAVGDTAEWRARLYSINGARYSGPATVVWTATPPATLVGATGRIVRVVAPDTGHGMVAAAWHRGSAPRVVADTVPVLARYVDRAVVVHPDATVKDRCARAELGVSVAPGRNASSWVVTQLPARIIAGQTWTVHTVCFMATDTVTFERSRGAGLVTGPPFDTTQNTTQNTTP